MPTSGLFSFPQNLDQISRLTPTRKVSICKQILQLSDDLFKNFFLIQCLGSISSKDHLPAICLFRFYMKYAKFEYWNSSLEISNGMQRHSVEDKIQVRKQLLLLNTDIPSSLSEHLSFCVLLEPILGGDPSIYTI